MSFNGIVKPSTPKENKRPTLPTITESPEIFEAESSPLKRVISSDKDIMHDAKGLSLDLAVANRTATFVAADGTKKPVVKKEAFAFATERHPAAGGAGASPKK